MAEQHHARAQALGARGADEVRLQHLVHAVAREPRHVGHDGQHQRDDGQHQETRVAGFVATHAKDGPVDAEHQRQQRTHDESRQYHAQHRKIHEHARAERITAPGGPGAERHAREEGQDGGGEPDS
jgi:hypothetical protein